MTRRAFLLLIVVFLSSCLQVHNDQNWRDSIPTTNNPNIVPNHSVSFEPNPKNPNFR